jgi:hypothetical protein
MLGQKTTVTCQEDMAIAGTYPGSPPVVIAAARIPAHEGFSRIEADSQHPA